MSTATYTEKWDHHYHPAWFFENGFDKDHWVESIKKLFDLCYSFGLSIDEAQIMLIRNMKKKFCDLKLDEITISISFIKNNYFRNFQILSPEYHEAIMAGANEDGREYREWFARLDAQHKAPSHGWEE
jgi:hypothetical protein